MGLRYNKEYIPKDRRIQTHGPRDLQRKQALAASSGPEVDMGLVNELRATIADLREQLKQKPATQEGMYTAEQVNDEIIKAVKAETADLKGQYEEKLKALEIEAINQGNKIREFTEKLDVAEKKVVDGISEAEEKYKAVADNIKVKYDSLLEERDSKIKALKEKLEEKDNYIKKLESISNQASITEDAMKKMLDDLTEKVKGMALAGGKSIEEVDPDRPKMETVFIDPSEQEGDVESHINIEEDVSITKKEEMAGKVDKLRNLIGKLPR